VAAISTARDYTDIRQAQIAPVPNFSNISRLTYNDGQTNSGECFARIDRSWNLFVKAFVGSGSTDNGHMNDEDFAIVLPSTGTFAPYSNTLSSNVTGNITYAVLDVGHDFWRAANDKVGGFVGYAYFKQNMDAFGCTPSPASIAYRRYRFRVVPASPSQILGRRCVWGARER
jgi:hypothetical protein